MFSIFWTHTLAKVWKSTVITIKASLTDHTYTTAAKYYGSQLLSSCQAKKQYKNYHHRQYHSCTNTLHHTHNFLCEKHTHTPPLKQNQKKSKRKGDLSQGNAHHHQGPQRQTNSHTPTSSGSVVPEQVNLASLPALTSRSMGACSISVLRRTSRIPLSLVLLNRFSASHRYKPASDNTTC